MHTGVELRETGNDPPRSAERSESDAANELKKADAITHVEELEGKDEIVTAKLRGCGRIYSFPNDALAQIPWSRANVRGGRDVLPIIVSRPPHIIIDSTRRFAVYSEKFIAVPHAWVGISGGDNQKEILQAMALYLTSDFAVYHQFLTSPEMGINKSKADLKTIRQLPIPVAGIERQGFEKWSDLYRRLVAAPQKPAKKREPNQYPLYADDSAPADVSQLETEVNDLAYEALEVRQSDVSLVSDLVHRRRLLIQGKVNPLAAGAPTENEMRPYCEMLKRQLDAFFEVATKDRHNVDVVYESTSAMVVVERGAAQPIQRSIRIMPAGSEAANALKRVRDRLVETRRQWLYFQRDLRKYSNETTYLFKPMQRIHWLSSQALVDAREVFADKTGAREI